MNGSRYLQPRFFEYEERDGGGAQCRERWRRDTVQREMEEGHNAEMEEGAEEEPQATSFLPLDITLK